MRLYAILVNGRPVLQVIAFTDDVEIVEIGLAVKRPKQPHTSEERVAQQEPGGEAAGGAQEGKPREEIEAGKELPEPGEASGETTGGYEERARKLLEL